MLPLAPGVTAYHHLQQKVGGKLAFCPFVADPVAFPRAFVWEHGCRWLLQWTTSLLGQVSIFFNAEFGISKLQFPILDFPFCALPLHCRVPEVMGARSRPRTQIKGAQVYFFSFLILRFILHPFYSAMQSGKEDVPWWYDTARLSPDYFRKDFRFAPHFALLLVILNCSHTISFRKASSAHVGYNS